SAVVVLGDGNTLNLTSTPSADGQIVASGGGFDVQVSHTYAEELNNVTFGVTVTDNLATTNASTSTFSVADAALHAGALTPPVATEGSHFTDAVVSHFTDDDPHGTPRDYSAVVVLGDGNTLNLTSTPSADGQIVASGGGFDVQVSHT